MLQQNLTRTGMVQVLVWVDTKQRVAHGKPLGDVAALVLRLMRALQAFLIDPT